MVAYEKIHKKERKIAPKDSFISLQHINKIYDNKVQAVYDFNLEIKKHEFIVFVGPSGCGKSTTLRTIEVNLLKNEFKLKDEIINRGNRITPLQILYHMNLGYPFLDENIK